MISKLVAPLLAIFALGGMLLSGLSLVQTANAALLDEVVGDDFFDNVIPDNEEHTSFDEDDEEEDLASGIISHVIDRSEDDAGHVQAGRTDNQATDQTNEQESHQEPSAEQDVL